MKEYTLTLTGLIISVAILLSTILFDIDLFEILVETLQSMEKYEVDEFIIPFVIFFTFMLLDNIRRQRSQKIEIEKVKIYKAMLSSTHHILNNFLNQMYIFRITADDTQEFPSEVLSLYDQIINDATIQIKALSSISRIDETSITLSVGIASKEVITEDADKPYS